MLAVLALAAALAQTAPTIIPEFQVTPARAGTKAKPRNALVYTKGTLAGDGDYTLSRLEYTIPRGIRIDGTGFPTCSVDFINSSGDDSCPKGSKVGTGAATAILSGARTELLFDVEVYAAGPKALTIYLQNNTLNVAIPGDINGRVVGFDIPPTVQQPVPGLYAYVTSVTAALGKQKGVSGAFTKNGKKRFFASTIGCKNGRHAGSVKAFLAANPDPPPVPFVSVSARDRCSASSRAARRAASG